MEACRSLLSPVPIPMASRTHLRTPYSNSVPMLLDQTSQPMIHVPATQVVHHITTSVLSKEQRDDLKTNHLNKVEKSVQATPGEWLAEAGRSCSEEREKHEFNQYLRYLECQLPYQPGLWYPFPPHNEEKQSLPVSVGPEENSTCVSGDSSAMQVEDTKDCITPADVLALAKKALIASKKAASLVEQSNILGIEVDKSNFSGFDEGSTDDTFFKEETTVRSRKLLERQSKKRKVSKNPNNFVHHGFSSMTINRSKKIDKRLDSKDPLRLFLWGPETKQLLTVKEEKDLFVKIEDLMRLEEVKERLESQSDREPTLAEWAQVVGMSCQDLQSCLSSGRRSREKMIYANFRLVVHVARQYEGKGLNIQDLLQEGSRGLMKSLEKFKPRAGCRFPTYAYWWIRQSIRKAIFQNSRTIRLPENVFALLKSIREAKRLCIQEGLLPTNEEIAKRVGITVQKLENLLLNSKNPISIQRCPWSDQNVTFQETVADPKIEIPDLVIAKKMMRQHQTEVSLGDWCHVWPFEREGSAAREPGSGQAEEVPPKPRFRSLS
ncbi:hypothetical protein OPV22_001177 [Ensete ventricosum]|uniref:RNA polymerase sigma-70 domain-containing protein n=1 Tax=Ensete ventricosum TaxID=4639 RepID=A0AAV8RUD0_ENSVE|nr:hypothetical protein OPV22_001177 [Ensete ventricosum]